MRNASAIELVIMLYDILARDLHGAIDAMEAGNIELRSAKLKHGFLALQQLEGIAQPWKRAAIWQRTCRASIPCCAAR